MKLKEISDKIKDKMSKYVENYKAKGEIECKTVIK